MRFTGLCTCPLGLSVSTGFILACAAAFCATIYGATSCRLLKVEFVSEEGGFEDTFLTMATGQSNMEQNLGRITYKAGIGLFSWLRPLTESSTWSEGACAGYQETVLNSLRGDVMFETSRGFGVLGVIFGIVIMGWGMLASCFNFNLFQVITLSIFNFLASVCAGLTLMLYNSSLCLRVLEDSKCSVDEGGLFMITASVMWFAAFLIAVVYFSPLLDKNNKDQAELLTLAQADIERSRRENARDNNDRRTSHPKNGPTKVARSSRSPVKDLLEKTRSNGSTKVARSSRSPVKDLLEKTRSWSPATGNTSISSRQEEGKRIIYPHIATGSAPRKSRQSRSPTTPRTRTSPSVGSPLSFGSENDAAIRRSPRKFAVVHDDSLVRYGGIELSPNDELTRMNEALRKPIFLGENLSSSSSNRAYSPRRSNTMESRRRQGSALTVDDVSSSNEMEVYISKRLDNIERIMGEV